MQSSLTDLRQFFDAKFSVHVAVNGSPAVLAVLVKDHAANKTRAEQTELLLPGTRIMRLEELRSFLRVYQEKHDEFPDCFERSACIWVADDEGGQQFGVVVDGIRMMASVVNRFDPITTAHYNGQPIQIAATAE